MSIRTLQRLYPYSSFPNLWIEGLLDCLWNNWNHHLFVHESLFAKTEHQYSTDKCASSIHIFMPPPLEKGGISFCNCRSVGRYVGLSVCRPSVVRSISIDPFTWSIPNLVQGLPSMSRWSLLIFRSHVQRSRSNHSSQPTVLSAEYLLTLLLDQYQTCCRGCP